MTTDSDSASTLDNEYEARLTDARSNKDTNRRTRALIRVVFCLPTNMQDEVIDEALATARTIKSAERRADALTRLVFHVRSNLRLAIIDEALVAARSVSDIERRASILIRLVDEVRSTLDLQDGYRIKVMQEALAAVRAIKDDERRANALLHLARDVSGSSQREVIHEALAATRTITDTELRIRSLVRFTRDVPHQFLLEVIPEVLSAARSVTDANIRERIVLLFIRYQSSSSRREIRRKTVSLNYDNDEDWGRLLDGIARGLQNNWQFPAVIYAQRSYVAPRKSADLIAPSKKGKTVVNHSGGVDLESDSVTVGGHVVGRDNITVIQAPDASPDIEKQRRVEATFPAQPVVGQIESLYVQVKMPESPTSPEARTRTMTMPFRATANTGGALPSPFKIKVIAPGFWIHGGAEKVLRIPPNEDSTELEFQLQCETYQAVKIQVEVYAESGFLGQVDLPVAPISGQVIPAPAARLWVSGVIVLGALPNATVSASW